MSGTRMAEELVGLYEEEKLHAVLGRAYGFAALAYSGVRDKERATEYAGLSASYARLMHGDAGEDVRRMRELEDDVQGHWSWGRRG